MHNVTLIKGDGIGPEISDAVVEIIKSAGVEINWDIQTAGLDVIKLNDGLTFDGVVKAYYESLSQ